MRSTLLATNAHVDLMLRQLLIITNASGAIVSPLPPCTSSWDYWADLVQPIASRVPYMTLPGNHETAPFDLNFVPYAHRFPMPWSSDMAVVLKPLQLDGDSTAAASDTQLYYR
jgi:hypothetical protein